MDKTLHWYWILSITLGFTIAEYRIASIYSRFIEHNTMSALFQCHIYRFCNFSQYTDENVNHEPVLCALCSSIRTQNSVIRQTLILILIKFNHVHQVLSTCEKPISVTNCPWMYSRNFKMCKWTHK